MRNGPYELVLAPENYPAKRYRDRYVYEHHLVWWQNTGNVVPPGHQIHHKNGNHRDNAFENLALMTSQEHTRHHAEERRKVPIVFQCKFCSKVSTARPSAYRSRLEANIMGVFCSIKCGARYQFRLSSMAE